MRGFIEWVVSRLKGKPYRFDPRVPLTCLTEEVGHRVVALVRGIWVLRRTGACLCFVGKGGRIAGRQRLRIGAGVTLGESVFINALSEDGVVLGNNVSVGAYSRIEATGVISSIGRGCKIGTGSGLGAFSFIGAAGGVEIGSNVIMGQYVSFHSENHNFASLDRPIQAQGVTRQGIVVGDDCWVGAKVTFLDGAHVGSGCVIAAGAVVRGVIPPNSVIGGVPAKVIRSREPSADED